MINDQILVAIITALPPTLVALGALVIGLLNRVKTEEIHILVNSNLTQIKTDLTNSQLMVINLTKEVADLKGVLQQRNTTHINSL
jgi:hypothetical protein